jgi:hypothetical protein
MPFFPLFIISSYQSGFALDVSGSFNAQKCDAFLLVNVIRSIHLPELTGRRSLRYAVSTCSIILKSV